MKYIEVPGSGSFVSVINREDDVNYYVGKYGATWIIPKEAVIPWDVTRSCPPWWKVVPDYMVVYGKYHLITITI